MSEAIPTREEAIRHGAMLLQQAASFVPGEVRDAYLSWAKRLHALAAQPAETPTREAEPVAWQPKRDKYSGAANPHATEFIFAIYPTEDAAKKHAYGGWEGRPFKQARPLYDASALAAARAEGKRAERKRCRTIALSLANSQRSHGEQAGYYRRAVFAVVGAISDPSRALPVDPSPRAEEAK